MNDPRDRKKRRHPTEHDSHRFVRVRADDETREQVSGEISPTDILEIEELPSYSEDMPEVDTATHAPFVHKLRSDPEQPARLGDLEVLWSRLKEFRGEQRRGRRETERQVGGVSSAARTVMEFQFKVRILWSLAVGGVAMGGGSAVMLIHGLQSSAATEATGEYRLRAAEDLVRDMAPRLRAAEEQGRMFALRLEEMGRAVGHNQPRTTTP